jgi:hypothetical protein
MSQVGSRTAARTMTERTASKRPKRWAKGRVRALAWVTGAATFLAGLGVVGIAPKPAASAAQGDHRAPRRQMIVRHITRRIVIVEPATSAPVTYVPAPTAQVGSTGVSSGVVAPAPPPPPPPASGGS